MDKVKLDVKDGQAVITEGGDSFLGKVLSGHKGKININLAGVHREVNIVKKLKKYKE